MSIPTRLQSSLEPASATLRRGLLTTSKRLTAHETTLWALAVVTLVLDVGTTSYGLRVGLTELNPFVNYLIPTFGLLGTLALLKGLAMTVGVATWRLMPVAYRGIVPLGLALPWGVAVTCNFVLLVSLHV